MQQINVLGTELLPCSYDPLTGYYRTGCCEQRGDDPGMHVVCCRVTDDFLAFSKSAGNDLSTPMPQYGFAGLRDHRGHLSFEPRLPQAWSRLAFPLTVGATTLRIEITPTVARFTVDESPLEIIVGGELLSLEPGQTSEVEL